VDKEIKDEYTKLVDERCLAMAAMLQALTLNVEKECVLSAATRLGLDIRDGGHATKKVKVDQRKVQPAPVTPRGRFSSVVSITSTNSHKRAYSPTEAVDHMPIQKTPTPDNIKGKNTDITTVMFSLKQELTLDLYIATPATNSIIRDAVELAQEVELTATQQSLRGSYSSIHNQANQMTIDPEQLVPADIFPPGIPLPPTNASLLPAMSCMPQFGIAEAHEDGIAPSLTPDIDPHAAFWMKMESQMNKFVQPIWDTIHRIESSMQDRIPRAPPRTGPGYRSEHINSQALKVSSAAIAPRLMNQGTRLQDNTNSATPLPSETLIAPVSENPITQVDDEEFLQLSQTVMCRWHVLLDLSRF
jgi:hypothetical protein